MVDVKVVLSNDVQLLRMAPFRSVGGGEYLIKHCNPSVRYDVGIICKLSFFFGHCYVGQTSCWVNEHLLERKNDVANKAMQSELVCHFGTDRNFGEWGGSTAVLNEENDYEKMLL